MNWNFETMITAFLAFFTVAVVLLVMDRKYGKSVWRFGHNWTHENPLPEGAEIGFLDGHEGLRNRLSRGFWISTLGTLLLVYFGHESFLTCVLVWLVGIPSAALGLSSGRRFGYIFDHRGEYIEKVEKTAEKVSETADKVRSGEISLKPDLGAATDAVKVAVAVAAAKVVDAAESVKDSVIEHLPEFGKREARPDQNVGEELKPVEPAPPEVSAEEEGRQRLEAAQAAIDKFTKGS